MRNSMVCTVNYGQDDQNQKILVGRVCSRNGRRWECFQNFNSPSSRWEDNSIVDLKEINISTRSWIISIPQLIFIVGLGGLEVTCSPRNLRFAGSSPAEGWIFSGCKTSGHKSSRRYFNPWVPSLRFLGSLKNLKPDKIGL